MGVVLSSWEMNWGHDQRKKYELQIKKTQLFNTNPSPINSTQLKSFQLNPTQLGQLQSQTHQLYRDPISQSTQGEAYQGDWIAAIEPVRLPDEPQFPTKTAAIPRKLMVVVQESESIATAPVTRLARQLLAEGILTLVVLSLVTGGLWYFVIRSTGDPSDTAEDQPVSHDTAPESHDLTTMAASSDSPPGH